MESKRFPRVNSLKPASTDDPEGKRSNGISGKVDGRQAGPSRTGNLPPSVDLGGNESPAWQDYFFLAPNVRFTRTPDYEASTRRHTSREQGDAGQNEQPTQPVPQATAWSIAPSHPALPAPTSDRNPALDAARPPAGSAAHAHGNSRQPASPGHPGDKARAGTATSSASTLSTCSARPCCCSGRPGARTARR